MGSARLWASVVIALAIAVVPSIARANTDCEFVEAMRILEEAKQLEQKVKRGNHLSAFDEIKADRVYNMGVSCYIAGKKPEANLLFRSLSGIGRVESEFMALRIELEDETNALIINLLLSLLHDTAETGYGPAQEYLGSVYCGIAPLARPVSQDFPECARWLKKAAELGETWSQAYLAGMYAMGEGVPQHRIRAYAWVSIAVANGFDGIEARDELASMLSEAELTEAQDLSAELWEQIEARKNNPTPEGAHHDFKSKRPCKKPRNELRR